VSQDALAPSLTPLDERVLGALDHCPGKRLRAVTAYVNRRVSYGGTRVSDADVRLILRGLEHLGRASGRGGWWRRAS
jgi:hypothetical protein